MFSEDRLCTDTSRHFDTQSSPLPSLLISQVASQPCHLLVIQNYTPGIVVMVMFGIVLLNMTFVMTFFAVTANFGFDG